MLAWLFTTPCPLEVAEEAVGATHDCRAASGRRLADFDRLPPPPTERVGVRVVTLSIQYLQPVAWRCPLRHITRCEVTYRELSLSCLI